LISFQPFSAYSQYYNLHPTDFSLISPGNDTITSDLHPTFTWERSYDNSGDNVLYKFYCTVDSTWASYTETSPLLSDTTYTMANEIVSGQSYWWRIEARDTYLTTNSSESWKIIVSQPPLIPTPISPDTGDLLTSVDYLVWIVPQDTDVNDEVQSYHIQIDNNSDFSSPEIDMTGVGLDSRNEMMAPVSGSSNIAFSGIHSSKIKNSSNKISSKANLNSMNTVRDDVTPGREDAYAARIDELTNFNLLADNTYYYWRVCGVDSFGLEGSYSSGSDSFIYYSNGIVLASVDNVVLNHSGLSIDLSWNPMQFDSNGQPVTINRYKIYRDENPSFEPSASNYVGFTTATNFSDFEVVDYDSNFYYRITAVVGVDSFSRESTSRTANEVTSPSRINQRTK